MTIRQVFTALALLITILLLVSSVSAQSTQTFPDYSRYSFVLDKALSTTIGYEVTLGLQNGAFRQAWAIAVPNGGFEDQVDARLVKLENGKITGTLKVGPTPVGSVTPGYYNEYELTLTVQGSSITGSYTGTTAKVLSGDPVPTVTSFIVKPEQVKWYTETPKPVSGTVLSGKVVTGDQARGLENNLARNLGWTAWYGPTGTYGATPGSNTIVDNVGQSRRVWKSEYTPPCRSQGDRYGGCLDHWLDIGATGGGASLVVWDNKVYAYYFIPSGDAYDTAHVEGKLRLAYNTAVASGFTGPKLGAAQTILDLWRLRADEVFHCLDAATGQTIWKTTIPDVGKNELYGKGSYTAHPAISDSIFVNSSSGYKTYGIHAYTGKVLWTASTEAIGRVICDGVVIQSGANVVGLDLRTGAQLYKLVGAGGANAIPVIWKSGTKSYFLAANASGKVTCAEVKTGTVVWTSTEGGCNNYSMMVVKDYLLLNVKKPVSTATLGTLGAYKLSATGMTAAWTIPSLPYDRVRRPLGAYGDYVYFRPYTDVNDPVQQSVRCIDVRTGKIVASVKAGSLAPAGFSYWVDGKLFLQEDVTHHPGTKFNLMTANPPDLVAQGGGYIGPGGAVAYWPVPMTDAFVDGRVFYRGTRGIYCSDLRKSSGTAVSSSNFGLNASQNLPVPTRTSSAVTGLAESAELKLFDLRGRQTSLVRSRASVNPFAISSGQANGTFVVQPHSGVNVRGLHIGK